MRRRTQALVLTVGWLPQLAMAHTMQGMGKFYGGMLHPLTVPHQTLALLVFALLVGQGGVRAMRFADSAFLITLTIGLVMAGSELSLGIPPQTVLLSMATGCGLLVALQWSPPPWLYIVLGGALGLVIGADSSMDGYSPGDTIIALMGCWMGTVLCLILVAGVVEPLHRPWQRIAVRVLGSWGTASAMLVLAMALR